MLLRVCKALGALGLGGPRARFTKPSRGSFARPGWLTCIATLAFAASATPSTAQGSYRPVSNGPRCLRCEILQERMAVLSEDTVAELIRLGTNITMTADTQFVLASTEHAKPYVVDTRGQVVRRIGRGGLGPGENQWPGPIVETDFVR